MLGPYDLLVENIIANSKKPGAILASSVENTPQIAADNYSTSYPARFKYNLDRSLDYLKMNPGKDKTEMELLLKVFASIPTSHHVLDLPCGGGRMSILLGLQGYPVTAADLSPSMRSLASRQIKNVHLECPVLELDIESLDVPSESFDTSLCFRLFHHFPNPKIRHQAIQELCRVSKTNVVISYRSAWSYSALISRLKLRLLGKKIAKYPTPLREIKEYFQKAGFEFVSDYARFPFFRSLHVAVFRRVNS